MIDQERSAPGQQISAEIVDRKGRLAVAPVQRPEAPSGADQRVPGLVAFGKEKAMDARMDQVLASR
jgi:hypothetical protein